MSPQILTPAVCDAIVESVSRGVPLKTAVLATGVSLDAFYKLLERSKVGQGISLETQQLGLALIDKLNTARAIWEAKLVEGVQATADNAEHRDSFKAKQFMLTHWPTTRETYYENRRSIVQHQGKDQAVQQVVQIVRELPADELLALAEGLSSEEAAE